MSYRPKAACQPPSAQPSDAVRVARLGEYHPDDRCWLCGALDTEAELSETTVRMSGDLIPGWNPFGGGCTDPEEQAEYARLWDARNGNPRYERVAQAVAAEKVPAKQAERSPAPIEPFHVAISRTSRPSTSPVLRLSSGMPITRCFRRAGSRCSTDSLALVRRRSRSTSRYTLLPAIPGWASLARHVPSASS
jgi:hypothetical protein